MQNKKPPFEITNQILSDIAAICELIGKASVIYNGEVNPKLRRENRIKTVYSSLAIEQNTLSIDQVTAVIAGKRVIAPPKDIAEVKNAYEVYERLDTLDPYSVDDLLMAHGVMTRGTVDESGEFRSHQVGVADKNGNILHFGTLPQYVPQLICELLDWVKSSDTHMLVKSCVFHYEFELIHPFSDGNGRMGRLWHTLLLSKWNPLFAWLPVESIIHDHQEEYYSAINISNNKGNSTVFIEFMLSVIKEALEEANEAPTNDNDSEYKNKTELRTDAVIKYVHDRGSIMNADVQKIFGVSPATANRILNKLAQEGRLKRVKIGSHWGYIML